MKNFHFGENLRIIRQSKGISQEAMALNLGMSQATYSRMESQSKLPDTELVERIAKILDILSSKLTSSWEQELQQQTTTSTRGSGSHLTEMAAFILNSRFVKIVCWMYVLNVIFQITQGFCDDVGINSDFARFGIMVLLLCFVIILKMLIVRLLKRLTRMKQLAAEKNRTR